MKRAIMGLTGAVAIVCLGCVIRTEHKIDAHVRLDIRHVQEQADEVLDFIEGDRDTLPALGESDGQNQSLVDAVFEFVDFMPVAHAAENMKTASPRVEAIAKSMRERHPKIEPYKNNGCFGENNRGYLELRDCPELEDGDTKNELQKLMAAENQDRKALYAEIARLNKEHGLSVSTVEEIYAMQRLRRAGSGDKVQLPSSGENFEEVKNSALCKKLGGECKPGAWVTIP